MQLLLEVERLTGRSLAASIMFEAATIRQLGESILQPGLPEASPLVQLQAGTGLSPFIYLDGDFSGGGYYARELARLLGPEQPFYVLRPRGLHGGRVPTIEQMARDYMPALALAQLRGPYRLGGHCNGALIALELAHQLTVAGDRVELVAMIDPISLNARPPLRLVNRVLASILYLFDGDSERRQMHLGAVMSRVWTAIRTIDEILHEADSSSALAARIRGLSVKMEGFDEEARRRNIGLLKGYYRAMASFIPPRVDARIVCLLTEPHRRSTTFNAKSWRHIAHELEVAVVPGDHLSCVTTHVGVLAHQLRACLSRLDASNAVTDRPYTSARIEGEGNVVMDETRFRDDPGEIVG
jgi:thioesterase domain-containing protein